MSNTQGNTGQDDGDAQGQRLPCVAGVLVGGSSRRMRRPKPLLALPSGRTLIEQVVNVIRALGPDVEEIVILGSFPGAPGLPTSLGSLRILPDTLPDAGPLAGLASLLRAAANRWGLLLSCDMPLIETTALRRLFEQARPDVDVVAFIRSHQPRMYHACCALYHPRILPTVAAELKGNKRSLQRVLAQVRVTALKPTADEDRQLTNVNTPAEHQRIREQLSRQADGNGRVPHPSPPA